MSVSFPMPGGVHTEVECIGEKVGKFVPQAHQKKVLEVFRTSPYPGMLLFHRLGSGKTCTAILIANEMMEKKSVPRFESVFVFSPGSLRSNFIKEYCTRCGKGPKTLTDRYTFITLNANVADFLPAPEMMEKSLLIVDEAHNMINGVKNGSKNATAIYSLIVSATTRYGAKVLLLTGTPIFNSPVDIPILLELIKPGSFRDVFIRGKADEPLFMDLFDEDDSGVLRPKNKREFLERLRGVISFVPSFAGGEYPRTVEHPPIKVELTNYQLSNYAKAFELEKMFGRLPKASLKFSNPAQYAFAQRMYIMAMKKILTRRAVNFAYPPELEGIITSATEDDDEETRLAKASAPSDDIFPKGWIKKEYFTDGRLGKLYSPKMLALMKNISKHFAAKHMVFSFFKTRAGVKILSALLEMCGVKSVVYSGDLTDSQRAKVLATFNGPDNLHGEKIRVILVTDAGAEGITLTDIQHLHILEGDARENKIAQVIGRAVRFGSHSRLPPSEREVSIWRYWTVLGDSYDLDKAHIIPFVDPITKQIIPTSTKIEFGTGPDKRMLVDEALYESGQRKMKGINSILDLLAESSVT